MDAPVNVRRGVAVDPAAAPRRRPRTRAKFFELLFLLPAVIFVIVTVLYPLGYNIGLSFFKVGIREVVSGGAQWIGLDNYISEFSQPAFWNALGISVFYTAFVVLIAVALGMLLALFFNLEFRGRSQMRALILIAWVLPSVVSANIWRWLFDGSYGLLNAGLGALGFIKGPIFWLSNADSARIAVVLASVWSLAPFAMILLIAGLQSVSKTLYEAARIDGASRWQQFWYVTMPILRPVTLTTALLCFIYTFRVFDVIFLMTQGGPGNATKVLTVYAYQEAFSFYHFGTAGVATTVLLIVPIVLALFYFRSVRKEERS